MFTLDFEKILAIFMPKQVSYLVRLFVEGIYLLNNKGYLKGLTFVRSAMRRRRKWTYLKNLAELPPFELWFVSVVVEDLATGEEVAEDVISINSLPSNLATGYRSMYAFGNHL